MDLNNLFKKQMKYAITQVALIAGIIIGPIVMTIGAIVSDGETASAGMIALFVLGLAILLGTSITMLVFWILGIVGAAKIYKEINDTQTMLLLIAAVLAPSVLYLIAVIIVRKNIVTPTSATGGNVDPESPANVAFARKLKQAFMDGIITVDEYEKKMGIK